MKTVAGSSDTPALVPLPQKLERRSGSFALRAQTAILVDHASRQTGDYLAERLRSSTGYPLPITEPTNALSGQGSIVLTTT
ncbi:MAG TPA: glycoside hydrolase family 20 zincin-like fold domain-containing protein, partial [Bacillota bacterium]|nr:glycoside hydrolase family 20 zincin-like fold domain-containing protein [Bacillota bacterium]